MIAHARKVKPSKKLLQGRPPLYPWDKWLDGQTWKLLRGKTYHCADQEMAKSARAAARKRGKAITARVTEYGVEISPRLVPDPSTAKAVAS